jgi:AhpD family alkylhydroperoxidase
MIPAVTRWLGVDVGEERKGFDAALIDGHQLLDIKDHLSRDEVIAIVDVQQPAAVAIDSPCCYAPDGQKTRECERRVNNEICGIRWTPDEARARGNSYYAWVEHGLKLYRSLNGCGVQVIEVFPTASWTRWAGPRGKESRARWSSGALANLGLAGVQKRLNQDQRDAIAAAVTAREYSKGTAERLGEIVVPSSRGAKGSVDVPARAGPTLRRASVKDTARDAYRAMAAFDRAIEFDPALRELIKIRTSQLNGCASCIDLHTRAARQLGESEQRIYALAAWRESPLFAPRERAALELADTITQIGERGVPDAVYEHAASEFAQQELANLILAIAAINAWNRIAVSSGMTFQDAAQ